MVCDKYVGSIRLSAKAALCLTLFYSSPVLAQNATWLGTANPGNWNTGANWSTSIVPTATAILPSTIPGTTTPIRINVTQNTSIGGISFTDLGAYQLYNVAIDNATFTITGNGVSGTGFAEFRVGNAGPATFEVRNSATLGNAQLNTDRFGTTFFRETSTAGTGLLTIMQGGTVDISTLTSPGMTSGPIGSDGTLFLGSKSLVVVSSTATVISGSIRDGGAGGGVGGSLTFAGTGGAIVSPFAAFLTLDGVNTYTGGTFVTGGTLAVTANGTLGDPGGSTTVAGGRLSIASTQTQNRLTLVSGLVDNGTLVANQFDMRSGTVSTILAGPGTLTKSTSGTVTLAGANTYTGQTTVDAGLLLVDGSIASSALVNAGGTIGGIGALRGGTIIGAGGTLAPGGASAMGTLSAANVTFGPGAVLRVRVDAAGNNDRLASTGTVSLGGATLSVQAAAGTYAPQTTYTIVTATGGISGQFGVLTSNLAFLTPSVLYGPNSARLVMTRNDTPLASVSVTPNQASTAGAVQTSIVSPAVTPVVQSTASPGPTQSQQAASDPVSTEAIAITPGTNPVAIAVLNSTAPGARQAFDALSGQAYAGLQRILTSGAGNLRDILLTHLMAGAASDQSLSSARPSDVDERDVATAYASGRSQPVPSGVSDLRARERPLVSLWGEAIGSVGTVYRNAMTAKIGHATAGFIAGADALIESAGRIGLAGGYTETQADLNALLSHGGVRTGFGSIYGAVSAGPVTLRGGMTFAGHALDVSRTIVFPGFAGSTRAKLDAWTGQIFGEASLPFEALGAEGATIRTEPFLSLAGIRVRTGSFAESGGGGAALAGGRNTQDVGVTTTGIRFGVTFGERKEFTVGAMAGYRMSWGDLTPKASLAFLASPLPAPFVIRGAPIDRHALVTEARFDWRPTRNVVVGVASNLSYGARALEQSFKGRVEVRF